MNLETVYQHIARRKPKPGLIDVLSSKKRNKDQERPVAKIFMSYALTVYVVANRPRFGCPSRG